MTDHDEQHQKKSTKVSKLELKQGDFWHGQEVEIVHSSGKGYIVYSMVGDDACSWYYENTDESVDRNLRVLTDSLSTMSYKFKGVVSSVLNRHLISVVKTIFTERSDPLAFPTALAAFDEKIESLPGVEVVVAQSKRFKVWVTEDHRIAYRVHKHHMTREVDEVIQAFKTFESFANAMLPPDKHSLFYRRLAAAFANRLEKSNGPYESVDYEELRSYVVKTVEDGLKVRYLLVAFSITFFFLVLAFFAYKFNLFSGFFHQAVVSIAGGVMGAFISVLERSKTIVVNEHESVFLLTVQCFLRVFLGAVLGVISIAAVTSGMAFAMFGKTPAALLLLGVVSGFSERLVPEMIEGISMQRDSVAKID
jgi:hypothetical protein